MFDQSVQKFKEVILGVVNITSITHVDFTNETSFFRRHSYSISRCAVLRFGQRYDFSF